MIELIYSNRTEALLENLVDCIKEQGFSGKDPLDPICLIVPNRNMETWLTMGIARQMGAAANLSFKGLETFIEEIVFSASEGRNQLADIDTIESGILTILLDEEAMNEPVLLPLNNYILNRANKGNNRDKTHRKKTTRNEKVQNHPDLKISSGMSEADFRLLSDSADLRRVQTASRMSSLFQEYSFSRPEMIASWRSESQNRNLRKKEKTGPSLNPAPFADFSTEPSLGTVYAWQKELWIRLFGEGGVLDKNPPPSGGKWLTYDLLLQDKNLFSNSDIPSTVHIFGISYVARLFQALLAGAGEVSQIRIYTLNPCAEFWEDVETHRELNRRISRSYISRSKKIRIETEELVNEDPFGLNLIDNLALRLWGRPGREHVRLLGELTDCDFTWAFADPLDEASSAKGILHRLQSNILFRTPENTDKTHDSGMPPDCRPDSFPDSSKPLNPESTEYTDTPETLDSPGKEASPDANLRGHEQSAEIPDESLRILAAPSAKREVEWVADEIWRLLEESESAGHPPLRFNDIAVTVNSGQKETYFPLIDAVFPACQNLPFKISDISGISSSSYIEAVQLWLNLPFGRISRPEMLSFMTHPLVISGFEDINHSDMAQTADRLGIFYGADRSEFEGTYIDEDVYNWDQGIRRIALGAFMAGEKSGENRIFETEKGRWIVEESASSGNFSQQFGLLARSLLSDIKLIRNSRKTFSQWYSFFVNRTDTYIQCMDESHEDERIRCLNALSKLQKMDHGLKISGKIAVEIASGALSSISSGSAGAGEGVVVTSFLPMRAIPFRAVFILGMGEGLFPAADQRDSLDLRRLKRRAGDVSPSERDRYMFLESLLCAREKLCLSYVRRDEQTGDPMQPSAVIQELGYILDNMYPGHNPVNAIRIEPPLRRYEDKKLLTHTFFDEAKIEAGLADPASRDRFSHFIQPKEEAPIPESSTVSTGIFSQEDTDTEKRRDIRIHTIRRFLGCPMQGWAESVLGLREEEEDISSYDEENFDMDFLNETILLKDVFLNSCLQGINPEIIYNERAERLRLKGQMPSGFPGQNISKRHKEVLMGWQSCLNAVLPPGENKKGNTDNSLPIKLQRIRLGRADLYHPAEKILDPLALNIMTEDSSRIIPVHISGLTEAFTMDESVCVILQKGLISGKLKGATMARLLRYFLKGIVDHIVLCASDTGIHEERIIIVCMANSPEEFRYFTLTMKKISKIEAETLLCNIIEDLILSPHDYILPGEAVLLNNHENQNNGKDSVDYSGLIKTINSWISQETVKFSSSYGPVEHYRDYPPPLENKMAEIISRRFETIFNSIIYMESS